MRGLLLIAGLLLVAPCEAVGQAGKEAGSEPLAGKWTMTVKAPPPHGDAVMSLELKQAGKKVKASFAPPHGEPIALEGEYVDGTLTLAAPSKDGDPPLSMTARVNADGTLAGFVSSMRGDMTWTAVRTKEKPSPDKSRP
jgi:hypothetical protein